MTRTFLSRSLRRALLLSLATPPLAACGGNVVVDAGNGGATGGIGGAGGAGSTTSTGVTFTTSGGTTSAPTTDAKCTLVSDTPVPYGVCGVAYAVAGTPADCGVPNGGALSASECAALCPPSQGVMATQCSVTGPQPGEPGGATVVCQYGVCTGRRPPGLVPATDPGRDAPVPVSPVARFLAHVAYLEAASVVAFDRLAAELCAHGAPDRLVRAARRSAREEIRHAEVTGRLAEQAGARPEPVVVDAPPALRSLEALALDNAVEGCVHETYGALVGMRQAEAARDPEVRREMKAIARDETRHAELSWELAAWLDGQLDEAARSRVRAARDRAVAELFDEIGVEPHPALAAEMGLATAAQARAAALDLRASLWA
jgi:hypothetical protein